MQASAAGVAVKDPHVEECWAALADNIGRLPDLPNNRMLGRNGDKRLSIKHYRLAKLLVLFKGIGQVVGGLRIMGINPQGLPIILDRLDKWFLGPGEVAQVVESIRMVRVGLENLPVKGFGQRKIATLMILNGTLK